MCSNRKTSAWTCVKGVDTWRYEWDGGVRNSAFILNKCVQGVCGYCIGNLDCCCSSIFLSPLSLLPEPFLSTHYLITWQVNPYTLYLENPLWIIHIMEICTVNNPCHGCSYCYDWHLCYNICSSPVQKCEGFIELVVSEVPFYWVSLSKPHTSIGMTKNGKIRMSTKEVC